MKKEEATIRNFLIVQKERLKMEKEEIKKVIDEIIEAKQNINNGIHKIIEIPEWYVDPEIKKDLRANAVQINDSIENIFYKINNEKIKYNFTFAVPKAFLENIENKEIKKEK